MRVLCIQSGAVITRSIFFPKSFQWRHNGGDNVSNHQRLGYLLNCLFRRRSKKASKLRVTGLCEGNSPVTGGFPVRRASNAENVSISWRHHVLTMDTPYLTHEFDIGRAICDFKVWSVFYPSHHIVVFSIVLYLFSCFTVVKYPSKFPIFFRITWLIRGQSHDFISASVSALKNMGRKIPQIPLGIHDITKTKCSTRKPRMHISWWRHQMETFSMLLAFMRGIHRSPVNSPHKGQWRRALMFSLICALNKQLSTQSWDWWFETIAPVLWRDSNVYRNEEF